MISITLREAALANYYSAERRAGTDIITATERMGEFAARLDALQDNLSVADFDKRMNQIATIALGVE